MSQPARISGLLFDLDGTLVDSAPDLVASLNWVRSSENLPPLEIQAMSRYASHGAAGLVRAGMPATNPAQFEKWKQKFLAHYADHSYVGSSLYPEVAELLDYLSSCGIPWGIVTNKSQALTHPVLRSAGVLGQAACVVCGDTLDRCKPDPAPVLLACNLLEVQPSAALFAGDDVRDLQAGYAAGTMTAAIHYGYGSHELDDEQFSRSIRIFAPGEFIQLVEARNGINV